MSASGEYEALIAHLCAKELNTTEIPLLTDVLGCHQPRYADQKWYFHTTAQPDMQHEGLVRDTLKKCVHWFVGKNIHRSYRESGLAILDGLAKHDRWRACLDDPDDARAFSVLLVSIVHLLINQADTQYAAIYKSAGVPLVKTVVDGWLPGTKFRKDGLPVPYLLMLSLFGESWCGMMLDGHELPPSTQLFQLLQSTQAVLMPGVLTCTTAASTVKLPDLDH
jgi:hypothetical protein